MNSQQAGQLMSKVIARYSYIRAWKAMIVSTIALGLIIAHMLAHFMGWQ